jgi:hypothetical protein
MSWLWCWVNKGHRAAYAPRSSCMGVYAAVWLMLKGERQNERLVSAILIAAVHTFPRHGLRFRNVCSRHLSS